MEKLDGDLPAELHHPIRGQTVIPCGAEGVLGHEREQLLSPRSHPSALGRYDALPAQEVCGLHGMKLEVFDIERAEQRGHVDVLGKPDVDHDAVQPRAL